MFTTTLLFQNKTVLYNKTNNGYRKKGHYRTRT